MLESLVLSKLDYACTVFHPLPAYQEKRLQRLQNACAGFVTRKFAALEDIIKWNWLPVKENVEFNILKLAHKSLCDNNSFPEYLKLTFHQVTAYNLRSSKAPVFSIPRESRTFQHSAATMLNRPPIETRSVLDHNFFCRSAKKHLFARYQSWILIIIIVYFNILCHVSSIIFIVITFLTSYCIYIIRIVYLPVTIMRFLD